MNDIATPSSFAYSEQQPTYTAPSAYNSAYTDTESSLLDSMVNYADYKRDPYTNQYAGQQAELLSGVTNFKYDPSTDPLYSAYKKQYTREGQRSMQDTLGSVSAATGGIPSSYAVSAGQQANDYYMGQLGDKIPELSQQAFANAQSKLNAVNTQEQLDYSKYWDGQNFDYQAYLDDYERLNSNLSAANALDTTAYNQYATDRDYGLNEYNTLLGQYNTNRNFGYGQYTDEIANQQYLDTTAYDRAAAASSAETASQQYADTLAQQDFENQYKIEALNQTAESNEYNNMLSRWKATGTADSATADYFGVDEGAKYGGAESEQDVAKKKAEIESIVANTAQSYASANASNAAAAKYYADINGDDGTVSDIDAVLNDTSAGNWTKSNVDAIKAEFGYTTDQEVMDNLGWDGVYTDGTGGETAGSSSWKDDYDQDSLNSAAKYAGLDPETMTESDIMNLIDDTDNYSSKIINGKIYIAKKTKNSAGGR
ncbi:MAG TPA: hypothetical protein PKL77_06030 [Candidatus Omnitrophota bacterium]|nr:hypothetical protein [Candidatus Omnitrophota bacterium]